MPFSDGIWPIAMLGDFSDRESVEEFVQCLNIDGLEVGEFLGSGNFSAVYKGTLNGEDVAIKVFTRDAAENQREIQVLEMIRGCPNCVQLITAPEDAPIFVMQFIDGIPSKEVEKSITVPGLRNIVRCILECLQAIHARKIVHRDLKLDNVLVARDFSGATVVDWGFGATVTPRMSSGIGARMYRSPEMLFNFQGFGTAADIWAVGVIILDLLSNHKLPWNGSNVAAELQQMTRIFGADAVLAYAKELGVEIADTQGFKAKEVSIEECVTVEKLRDADLIDLMKQLLTLDYRLRPTAAQALQHAFFSK